MLPYDPRRQLWWFGLVQAHLLVQALPFLRVQFIHFGSNHFALVYHGPEESRSLSARAAASQKQMHPLTHHLHLLTPTRHRPSSSPPTNATRFESGVVVFSLNQLHESIQSNTSAWQCVAYFPTMIFYIYCILSYMVYYVALSLCGYKCPKVYKQRILKHPVQQNANITATIYWPTSFYIHYMYYIYIQ